jgi:hypothetical protein
MATLVIIGGGGGEQDYREGANPYGEARGSLEDPRANVKERLGRDLGNVRDDQRSERNLRRYERGQSPRRRRRA